MGIDHESEASFYRAQKKYSNRIINAAKDSWVETIHGIKGKLKTSTDELTQKKKKKKKIVIMENIF